MKQYITEVRLRNIKLYLNNINIFVRRYKVKKLITTALLAFSLSVFAGREWYEEPIGDPVCVNGTCYQKVCDEFGNCRYIQLIK